ncbi:murein L,D-transpeptidase [Stappia sp. ES.058]|uniref:L,D-transpeptidase family protein n=1 Tax=Stappia sp. ES.058 TaxID=1881061 RepID=UPI00087A3CE3|nr:L,D-transpeptidase family protein [Stappia sp. ES.058]SDU16977.1 Murein L,D-transpeptidase YcbB/YkuD [Stappia sp. ES.058]
MAMTDHFGPHPFAVPTGAKRDRLRPLAAMPGLALVASVTIVLAFSGSSLAQETARQAEPATGTPPAAGTLAPADAPATILPTDPLAMAISRELSTADTLMLDAAFNAGSEEELQLGVQEFYEARIFQPLWVSQDGLNSHGELLIKAFEDARAHALDPAAYDPDRLFQIAFNASGIDEIAAVEVALSNSYITYANDMVAGRVKPNEVNPSLNLFPQAPDPASLLEMVESSEDFALTLDALSPNTPNYARLKERLGDYRAKAEAGGFTPVPAGETLKPGMSDPRLDALRKRLAQQDLFTAGSHQGDVYDGALVAAVELFQERHGLTVDGIVGKNTLAEINVAIETRIEQMELNMERRRWMPDDLGDRYVFVNLADQNLKVVKSEKTVHTARVVVGKPYHATPVFSDQITYAEVNPYWTVPYSIATKEYLPQLRKNPGALLSKNIRIFSGNREVDPWAVNWQAYGRGNFPFTLRQDPGNRNALGRIKFMFPNKFNIYIHDTPSKSLFARSQRSFSHGCIRTEKPFDLGEVLLGDDGWTKPRLLSVRSTGKRRVIKLKDPIPVHLTYLTAWVNKDGSTHFRRDIYGRDKVLKKAITALAPVKL